MAAGRALRTSLALFTAEGAAAEVVAACCGGTALVGWALRLGMTPSLTAALLAMPIGAQILQLPGALFTRWQGHRRTVLFAATVSRMAFLPLACLPALPMSAAGQRGLLLCVALLHHGFAAVATGALNDWMGEVVPAGVYGRYFGRRIRASTFLGALTGLAVGLALQGEGVLATSTTVLQYLAIIGTVVGGLSITVLLYQRAAPPSVVTSGDSYSSMAYAVTDPDARLALVLTVGWHAACGLSAPFFGLYLVRELRAGYLVLAAYGTAFAMARVASAADWGRIVDRFGARNILVACTTGLTLSPIAWLCCAPGRLWPLALDAVIGGALFGGHTIASFALPFAAPRDRSRLFHLATIAAAGGAAFAITSATGALAASAAPDGSVRPLLAVSAALRALSVALALGSPKRAVSTANSKNEHKTRGSPWCQAAWTIIRLVTYRRARDPIQ